MKLKIVSVISLLLLTVLFCGIPLKNVEAIPVYEDYTTYTEVDPNNHIATTSNTVDFNYYMNEDAYLYDDKGAGNIANFTHHFDAMWDNKSNTLFHRFIAWIVANDLDDAKGLKDTSKDYFAIAFTYTGGSLRIQLMESDGGTLSFDEYIGITHDTWYYFSVQRYGTVNITVRVYSDFARTSLLDTLSISSVISTNFRYVYGCNNWRNGQNQYGWGFMENLTISELPSRYLTFYRTEGGIFRVEREDTANGTQTEYSNGTILEFSALTLNSTWLFINFTFGASYNDTNPYNYTITQNQTIWLYFQASTALTVFGVEKLFVGFMFLGLAIAFPIVLVWKRKYI